MRYSGDAVVVTGAFGEIGSEVCAGLLSEGRTVCRVSRLPGAGRGTDPAEHGRTVDITADLATAAGWDRVLEAAAAAGCRIEALVHCAGALIAGDCASVTAEQARKMVDDNIMSLMLGCRAVIPGMIRSGRGRVVILGSLGGIVPMPHVATYAAVKFAVRGYALSLAEELKGTGVDVSLLSCGPVRSRMLLSESAHYGSIGFVNRPLAPARVAAALLRLLDHPRREAMLPRSSGWISVIAGGHAGIFRRLYPAASLIGDVRKKRYRRSVLLSAGAGGSRS